ncbi:MAG TPA: helix-turn-helix domain-containing protein [Solirubrobacteraceae bacterium]|jgi:DNA-binding PucR family transcriptional regulator|nr:helix-turn-helix domain-containing protein [Solirubrobacteraceae bacterium]
MSELGGLDAVTEAVESGAGLPEVVRAASRALDASLAVTDAAGATIAVAARSSADERSLLAGGEDVASLPLRVADAVVGTLHMRARTDPSPLVRRLLVTMIASEVERVRAPDVASENAAADFLRIALARNQIPREELLARAAELSLELKDGASVIVARAHPQAPTEEGWRARARAVAERGARAVVGRSIAALSEREGVLGVEILLLVPGSEEPVAARAADAVLREMQSALSGNIFALGRSRIAEDPGELARAAAEALLAANVAEGGSQEGVLAFEQTGAYRLLLSAMSENPSELQRFYAETVEPLVAYDEQYETELLQTLETFLEADGNVAGTAQRLFTHRHTVYYRLERVRELTGLDVSSSDGREKLSLGLKAMRVLGISSARGPASEDGARGGRVPRRT